MKLILPTVLASHENYTRFDIKKFERDPQWTCPRCQDACVCPACRRKREVQEPLRRSSSRKLAHPKLRRVSEPGLSSQNLGLPKNLRSGRKFVLKVPKKQRFSEIS